MSLTKSARSLRIVVVALAVAFTLATAGCGKRGASGGNSTPTMLSPPTGTPTPSGPPPSPLIITAPEPRQTATVEVGQRFVVILRGAQSNPSEWILRNAPDVVSAESSTPAREIPAQGANSAEWEWTFTFQGARPGQGEIEFVYEPAGSKSPPEKHLIVGVNVIAAMSPSPQ